MDTFPKVMAMHWPDVKCEYNSEHDYFIIETEPGKQSEVWIGGCDDEKRFDKLLGKEYASIYANEASEIDYQIFTNLKSRLAQKVPCDQAPDGILPQRMYADLNPTASLHWTHHLWIQGTDPATGAAVDKDMYAVGKMNPRDNPLLDEEYIKSLHDMPPNERKRFYEGEYAQDTPGALWNRAMIRYSPTRDVPSDLVRIVVAVDPNTKSKALYDSVGIVVAGIDRNQIVHVLEDASGKHPVATNEAEGKLSWARIALALYMQYEADCIVAETNQGGDMVEKVIRAEDCDTISDDPEFAKKVPYKEVKASRGKAIRAEPVAALYGRGKVIHRLPFPVLEDQMCSMTPDFDRERAGYSPDNLDAAVWAVTDLFNLATKKRSGRGTAPRRSMRHDRWSEFV